MPRLNVVITELRAVHRWGSQCVITSLEKRLFILSGEAHYFRLMKTHGELRLAREELSLISSLAHQSSSEFKQGIVSAIEHVAAAGAGVKNEAQKIMGGRDEI